MVSGIYFFGSRPWMIELCCFCLPADALAAYRLAEIWNILLRSHWFSIRKEFYNNTFAYPEGNTIVAVLSFSPITVTNKNRESEGFSPTPRNR